MDSREFLSDDAQDAVGDHPESAVILRPALISSRRSRTRRMEVRRAVPALGSSPPPKLEKPLCGVRAGWSPGPEIVPARSIVKAIIERAGKPVG